MLYALTINAHKLPGNIPPFGVELKVEKDYGTNSPAVGTSERSGYSTSASIPIPKLSLNR